MAGACTWRLIASSYASLAAVGVQVHATSCFFLGSSSLCVCHVGTRARLTLGFELCAVTREVSDIGSCCRLSVDIREGRGLRGLIERVFRG